MVNFKKVIGLYYIGNNWISFVNMRKLLEFDDFSKFIFIPFASRLTLNRVARDYKTCDIEN